MFARESTHRGSVCRHSAASPQVLFLLEGSLTYHCAWLLAGTPELRSSPHSVCVVTRALSTWLLLSPLAECGWDAVALESVCLLSRARHWCRNPAGTTQVRPPFQRLHADACTSLPRSCSVVPPCRCLAGQANLFSAVFCIMMSCDSCSRRCMF